MQFDSFGIRERHPDLWKRLKIECYFSVVRYQQKDGFPCANGDANFKHGVGIRKPAEEYADDEIHTSHDFAEVARKSFRMGQIRFSPFPVNIHAIEHLRKIAQVRSERSAIRQLLNAFFAMPTKHLSFLYPAWP